jgi:Flp pilus assembly protein TadB
MFYVLIFSLAAVILIVAFFTAVSRRRRAMQATDAQTVSATGHAAHRTHPDAAGRRNRKAKRSQSQYDRRKRH